MSHLHTRCTGRCRIAARRPRTSGSCAARSGATRDNSGKSSPPGITAATSSSASSSRMASASPLTASRSTSPSRMRGETFSTSWTVTSPTPKMQTRGFQKIGHDAIQTSVLGRVINCIDDLQCEIALAKTESCCTQMTSESASYLRLGERMRSEVSLDAEPS
jgi:hypothetical protein